MREYTFTNQLDPNIAWFGYVARNCRLILWFVSWSLECQGYPRGSVSLQLNQPLWSSTSLNLFWNCDFFSLPTKQNFKSLQSKVPLSLHYSARWIYYNFWLQSAQAMHPVWISKVALHWRNHPCLFFEVINWVGSEEGVTFRASDSLQLNHTLLLTSYVTRTSY